MTPLLVAVALVTTPTVDLEQISFDTASDLDGRTVRTSFVVGAPPYTLNGTTVFGTGDRDDDTERTVYLPAVADLEAGDTVFVEGVLRVRRHPAAVVNGQVVPAYGEIRIEDAKFID